MRPTPIMANTMHLSHNETIHMIMHFEDGSEISDFVAESFEKSPLYAPTRPNETTIITIPTYCIVTNMEN